MGRKKKADTPEIKPSAIESEIHPSHKLRLCSVYFAIASSQVLLLADEFGESRVLMKLPAISEVALPG